MSASNMVHLLVCEVNASCWQETSISHHIDISLGQPAFLRASSLTEATEEATVTLKHLFLEYPVSWTGHFYLV